MPEQTLRKDSLQAVLNNPYDGAIRILADIQRFGLCLQSLQVEVTQNGLSILSITITGYAGTDINQLVSRLGRHPSVESIQVGAMMAAQELEAA
jgi:hypothetical protein